MSMVRGARNSVNSNVPSLMNIATSDILLGQLSSSKDR